MNCCSTGLAVSKIIHVNAPAQTLWDVLTDVEAYPNFVETIKSTRIKLPAKWTSQESSSTSAKSNKVQVGTSIYEERCKKRHKNGTTTQVVDMRRTITNIIENESNDEYSISFSSQFDHETRRFDLMCNTSTLSIVPSQKLREATGDDLSKGKIRDSCELVGSLAVEVGGAGSTSTSLLALCPVMSIICCKRKITSHAERHFEEELRNYGTEAERRYHQQQVDLAVTPIGSSTGENVPKLCER